jgi:hypothetical protein
MKLGVKHGVRTYELVFALISMLALSAISLAQVSKGSISGTVSDPTGAVVEGAQVMVTHTGTGQVTTTTSDGSGIFKIPLLAVGAYKLQISKAGFRVAVISSVEVNPGVDTGLGTIALQLGATAETVEVSSGTPLVETTQSQVTATFGETYMNNIPGIQENQGLDNLAVLLPGVANSRDNQFSNTNGVGFSVDGLRGRSNDQQVDGQNNNDNSVTGPGIFMADTNFVDQYQVTTNNFGAEYGRNSGSVVNVITKSGTNVWHGAIYGTESNSVLTTLTNQQRNTVWGEGLTKPPRFNDEFTGATIGGPWVKNKIFFFGGFDNEIISSNTVYANGAYTPTPLGISQLSACFPGSTSMAALSAYGPYAVGGGNPTSLGAPVTKYYDNAPVNNATDPVTGAAACGYQLAGVQRTLPDGSHQYNWVARLDVTGSKDTVYGRYLFQKQTFFNVDEGQAAQGYPVNVPSLGQGLQLSWTHKISDSMLNEVRASAGRQNVQFGGNTIGNTVPTTPGLTGGLASIAFGSSSLLGYGPLNSMPQGRIVNTYQIQDNWSYLLGKHQMKAGANITIQKSPNTFLPYVNGGYTFSDWGAYAANIPSSTNITLGPPRLDFIEHDSFFYFGDDWKLTSHLTLNLGLTYSYYGQPANLFNTNDARQQSSSQPFWNTALSSGVTVFPRIPAPKNSWGPSVGFAYAVGNGGWLLGDNKTVIRGGYRLAYDTPFYNIYLNIASSAPQVLAQTIVPGQPLPAAPTGPNVRTELASYLQYGVSDPRAFNQTNVAPNFKPDRVHSWSLGIQRELGPHAAAEIRYVGNHGQDLFQSINGNPYVGCGDPGCVNPLTGAAEIPGLSDAIAGGVFSASLLPSGVKPCPAASAAVAKAIGRANCDMGVLRTRSNTAYSDYEGLQTEIRTTNLFRQLTMRANYTWSKTTDNASEIYGTFGAATTVAFSQDPWNYTSAEHGLSGLDFPQSFALSLNEDIPAYRSQRGILGHAFGGWSISGTYILQSGQTYTPGEYAAAFSLYGLNPYNVSDQSFLGAFNSSVDTTRPFLSNRSASPTAVGIYAADACNYFGVLCNAPGVGPTDLYDFTAMNANGAINTVSANQVHYILNGYQSEIVNGTPWGNAGRNSLRDFWTNMANFQVSKTSNWGDRVRLVWHMSMVNAFNHPNYASIDPFLEDAGLVGYGTGFANPTVQAGGNRAIRFGMRVAF